MTRRHKYNVAPAAERTFNGVVYHSKAEMLFAKELTLAMQCNEIDNFGRQIPVALGPDFATIVDFCVIPMDGDPYYVEVKGAETPAFRKVRKLWRKYGPAVLYIKKRRGAWWTTEKICGPA